MSTKRKKDARISTVELKSLGLKQDDEVVEEEPVVLKSEKKKEKTDKTPSANAKKVWGPGSVRSTPMIHGSFVFQNQGAAGGDMKQSKISDFVAGAGGAKVDVSFEGRLESFTQAELSLLASFLQAKTALSKPQLALAVEVWNSNPPPDTFQFRKGEHEGRSMTLNDLHKPDEGIEHVMFRERSARMGGMHSSVMVAPPPPPAARPQKKK
jgi:hypothetical protein